MLMDNNLHKEASDKLPQQTKLCEVTYLISVLIINPSPPAMTYTK